jgi:hypothetical protein
MEQGSCDKGYESMLNPPGGILRGGDRDSSHRKNIYTRIQPGFSFHLTFSKLPQV